MKIVEKHLRPVSYSVSGFTGDSVTPTGAIKLPVQIGDGYRQRNIMADFLVVDIPAAFNSILGRPLMNDM